ncbi:MAG TPA: hypothetical protein PKV72_01695, partial [Candidatus Peribacteria bacterium]|nr:hypothetical protein [Candidatus Peribacteria bacterium]
MMWNTLAEPGAWTTPQFPPGQHKMKWIVEDGCGNVETCEHLFAISSNTFAAQQTLQGTTVIDADTDCQPDATEMLLSGWRARLESAGNGGNPFFTQYSTPFIDGKYRFWVDTGS